MYACGEYKHLHGEAGGNVSVSMKLDFDSSKKTSMNVQTSDTHASRSLQTLKGNREIVELLIARGADVNVKDRNGQTALSYAIRNNLPEIAEILRKSGVKE
jgi:ankyrin repeat protein